MNTKRLIRSNANKFDKGYERVSRGIKDWKTFEGMASPYFTSITKEALNQKLFDFHANFITLFFGQHVVGYDYTNKEKSGSLAVEKGCALHYSQGSRGKVACVIYLFSSELEKPNTEFYIRKIYKSPARISSKAIQRHTRLMFSVAQVSSCFGVPSLWDKIRVKWLKTNHWMFHWRRKDIFENILETFKTAFSLILKIVTLV
jgi:hypothetical protein